MDDNDSDDTGFPCSTVHVCMVEAELMMTRKITVISLVEQAFKSTFFSSRDQCWTQKWSSRTQNRSQHRVSISQNSYEEKN